MPESSLVFLDDPDRVVEVLSPIRREILATLDEPDSATGIARRIDTTRQKVNYHLHALEDAGLVEVDELRSKRGLTERMMRRTADVVLVDPAAFDAGGLSRADAVGLTGVVSTAIDTLRHAARVAAEVSEGGERVAAASLDGQIRVASPAKLKAMLTALAEVVASYDTDEEGLVVRVTTSVLPAVDR